MTHEILDEIREAARDGGRITGRCGNLILLEFDAPAVQAERREKGRKPERSRFPLSDALFLALFLSSVVGCIAAFRY